MFTELCVNKPQVLKDDFSNLDEKGFSVPIIHQQFTFIHGYSQFGCA